MLDFDIILVYFVGFEVNIKSLMNYFSLILGIKNWNLINFFDNLFYLWMEGLFNRLNWRKIYVVSNEKIGVFFWY